MGQVICQFVVQELGINALDLSKARTDKLEFNQLSMQRFTQAVNRAMPKVDEYFRKLIEKSKHKFIDRLESIEEVEKEDLNTENKDNNNDNNGDKKD